MNFSKSIRALVAALILFVPVLFFTSCDNDDPAKEDTPELITSVALIFTPASGGAAITATAIDPDGEGIQDLQVDGPINLVMGTTYTLSITLVNGLVEPTDPEYNITEEVEEESDEHMFFFAWTNNVFSNPAGNGNVDNRSDDVIYNDEDDNGLPLGLSTTWTTTNVTAAGTFRIILKHQPDLKSASSTAATGESDVDIEFTINVN